jgi:hypothetical protein
MDGRPLLFQKISIENAICNFWIDFGTLSIKDIHMCNATKHFEMWDNQFFCLWAFPFASCHELLKVGVLFMMYTISTIVSTQK